MKIDLDTLERIAKAATQGQWWIDSHGHQCVMFSTCKPVFITDSEAMGEPVRHHDTGNLSSWPNDNDATYIATMCPEMALSLVERIRQLEKQVHNLQLR